MTEAQILIVEDEPAVAEVIRFKLKNNGYVPLATASSGEEAIRLAGELRPDLALMDIGLAGNLDGVVAAAEIHTRFDIPVVYMTAHSDESTLARARASAPYGYILKPFDDRELRSTLEIALYRHEQEQRVRESEARYRDLYENAPNAYFSVGTDGLIRQCNRRASELLGFPKEELVGRSAFELYADTPQGKVKAEELFEQFLADGEVCGEELQMRRADGTLLWVSLTRNPVRDAAGKIVESRSVVMDITARKEAEQKLLQRAAQLELLNDIGGQIAATLHLDSVLAQATRLVQQKFGYHHVAVFTLDRQQQSLVMRASAGSFSHLFPSGHRLAVGQGVVGWVGDSGQTLLANDVDAEPRYVNLYPDVLPTRAELSVPIQIAGRMLGVLDVQSPQRNAFDDNDVLVIQTVADQIGVAIENARLYETSRREVAERRRAEATLHGALRDLEQHQVELAALLSGARAILKHREFEDSARVMFDICKHLLGAEAGYVGLLGADGLENEVLFLDPGGLPCIVDPSLPRPIRDLRAEAYRTDKVVYRNDLATSEWAGLLPEGHVAPDNVLFAPLVIDGQAVGLLGLAHKPGGFDEEDARMATAFGELAAIALRNSRTLESLEESEERFRSVVQTASDAIITADSQGTIAFCNDGAETVFGYAPGELVGRSLSTIMPERFRAAHQEGIASLLAIRESPVIGQTVEMVGLRGDGSEFPLELSLASWTVGGQVFFTVIARDITERVQLQREIEHRRQYLESVLAYAPDAIVTLDNQHRVLDWNQGAHELFGYSPQEVVGRDLDGLITGGNAPTIEQATGLTRQILAGQPVLPHETVRYRRDGTPVNVIAAGSPIHVGDKLVGIVAVYTNITGRKQAEQALQELNVTLEDRVRQRTAELRVLHELTQEIGNALSYDDLFSVILQHLGRLSRFDITASLFVDHDVWEVLLWQLRPVADRVVEEVKTQVLQAYEGLAGTNCPQAKVLVKLLQPDTFDPTLPALDHVAHHIQVPISVGEQAVGLLYVGSEQERDLDYDDDLRLLYTLSNQASDSIRRLQALLAEEQRRLERLIEHLPEGILLVDAENRVTLNNPAAAEILSLLGTDGQRGGPAQIGPYPLEKVLREATGPRPLTLTLESPASRAFEISAQAIPADRPEEQAAIVVLRDVTEARRIEKQMQQQDRLAAIGQLAGGIAHDFNNILTTIILHSQVALRQKAELPLRVVQGLEAILNSGRRAADLVRQILDFSRHSEMETHALDLGTYVEGVMKVLERTLPESIFVSLDKGGDECIVDADPTRIQQVLMNLVVNARDAMPKGGTLRVALSTLTTRPGEPPPLVDMPPGKWVGLSVADTGTGILPEVAAHLFEPFFTTKPRGQGTGLGLAQVYGIVAQHKGYIGLETQVGRGSTFTVYLPAHESEEVAEFPEEQAEELPARPRGAAQTILLVEDEQQIRELGQALLEEMGYRVLVAADGQQALEAFRLVGKVDLLITDVVMPQMGGKELIEELRLLDPHLKAVAISGYALSEDVEEMRQSGIVGIVPKPFDEHTLAHVIRRALAEGQGEPGE
jgi:PAS domain S-box-containing protein